MEVNRADKEMLLRVPGIGVKSALKILTARRAGSLTFEGLKKLVVVLKRAVYFITCNGKMMPGAKFSQSFIYQNLTADVRLKPGELPLGPAPQQLSLFDNPALLPGREERMACLTGQL